MSRVAAAEAWPSRAWTVFTDSPCRIKVLPVRLPEGEHERLRQFCQAGGFGMAVVIRALVERFLDQYAAGGGWCQVLQWRMGPFGRPARAPRAGSNPPRGAGNGPTGPRPGADGLRSRREPRPRAASAGRPRPGHREG